MKQMKALLKKVDAFLGRYINGTRGAIAILLTILMVPFATIAGVLINAARINSAVAIFDEALCNASNSTLGTYDDFLKKRFGLLAIAQSDPSMEGVYSAEEFISETFAFYMEENMKALHNAYESTDISASGVYPLADTDVLMCEVMEYGKYAIPTKMVIDGLSLDKLLESLSSGMKNVSAFLNVGKSGLNLGDSFKTLQEDMTAYVEELVNYEAALAAYELAYTTFKNAVIAYNSAVNERQTRIQQAENAVSSAETNVASCEKKLKEEAAKVQSILDQITALENEKDSKGNPVDNSEEIAALKKEHEEELKPYYDAEKALSSARTELSNAKKNLETTKNNYETILEEKRSAVVTARGDYAQKIGDLADQVAVTSEAATTARSSASATISASASFAKDTFGAIDTLGQSANSKKIGELKKQKEEAVKKGDTKLVEDIDKQIQELNDHNTEISNANKVGGAAISAESDLISSLTEFTNMDLEQAYQDIEDALRALKPRVEGYVTDTGKGTMESADGYYLNINSPASSEEMNGILENLASNLVESTGLALLKSLIGFVKALLKIGVTYDPLLIGEIDTTLYDDIGGLPSTKDRTSGSDYNLDSEYEKDDRKKSEEYKEILGSYSSNGCISGSISEFERHLNNMLTELDELEKAMSDITFLNIFQKIADIATHGIKLLGEMAALVLSATGFFDGPIYSKMLTAGYVAYNTANRTTCSGGKALTGASFGLPSVYTDVKESENTGYIFNGAETEYIMCGKLSEKENQKGAFNFVFGVRFLIDLVFIFSNSEVNTIAGSAGAAIPVIGAVIVYALYALAEPLVDSILLCNGGSVPVFKTKIYLTPTGLPDLLSSLSGLKLDEALKAQVYGGAVEIIGKGTEDEKFAGNYDDAKKEMAGKADKQGELEKALCFNYTKTLLLYLMFMDAETQLERLADIIQMECTYNAVNNGGTSGFNLDKSYTYIRASGSFRGTQFITVTDQDLVSTQRIVYRGY